MTKDADDLRSAAVQESNPWDEPLDRAVMAGARASDWIARNVPAGELRKFTAAAIDSALAAAPAPQPTAAQKIDPDITPENQWFGDMMILQVLADSDQVNDQEREVLQRWIAASQPPGAQQDGPSAFRDAVLEEAAKRCDQINDDSGGGFEPFAEAIRAMKGQP